VFFLCIPVHHHLTIANIFQALQNKYDSLKKAHCTLQTEFLNVYEQIGRLEAQAERSKSLREPPAAIAVPSKDTSKEQETSSSNSDDKNQCVPGIYMLTEVEYGTI